MEFVGRGDMSLYGLALLFWIGLILAVTEGHPHERALLLRVCVSVVYASSALSKTNPAWLAGEDIARMASSRTHPTLLLELAGSAGRQLLPILIVVVEAWMAIGLWLRVTRRATAGIGFVLHSALIMVASATMTGLANLTVLNLGLVAMYLAFWRPIVPPDHRGEHPAPASAAPLRR
jgi:hypothetical protein